RGRVRSRTLRPVRVAALVPEVDGLVHLPRRVRPIDAPPRPRRLVGGVDDLEHLPAVLARLDRRLLAPHAAGEGGQLLGEAVVPDLLEHGEREALRRRRLLDGVAVARLAVGQERAAAQQVGAGEAARAVDFAAVIDAALLGPAVLGQADLPALVLD